MKTADVYRLFFNPGEVVEIRAYGLWRSNPAWEGWAGGEGIVFGYFDDAEAFGRSADALEKLKAPAVYFTLNPVLPDLIARACNRMKAFEGKKMKTTSDKDIQCVRWLPLDIDAGAPAGISSTDDEMEMTRALRKEISKFMIKEMGFAPGVPALSGNGSHMCYRLPDLPNNEETTLMIKGALHAIAERFPVDRGGVDLAVYNPARVWKVYGTTARKGDPIPTRPHRLSYVEPEFLMAVGNIPITPVESLKKLAGK
jgi:hypothetical protein